MSLQTEYNLLNLVKVLAGVHDLKERELMNISQLLAFVEMKLDEKYGRCTHRKYICVRATFDRYWKRAGQVEWDQCPDLRPFLNAITKITKEAYPFIIEHCKKMDPDIFDQ